MKMRYLPPAAAFTVALLNAAEIKQYTVSTYGPAAYWQTQTNLALTDGKICQVYTLRGSATCNWVITMPNGSPVTFTAKEGDVLIGPAELRLSLPYGGGEAFGLLVVNLADSPPKTPARVEASQDLERWKTVDTVNLPATAGTNTFFRLAIEK